MTDFEFVTRLVSAATCAEEDFGFLIAGHGSVYTLKLTFSMGEPRRDGINIQLIYGDEPATKIDEETDEVITTDRKVVLRLAVEIMSRNGNPIKAGLFKGLSDIKALEKLERLAHVVRRN